MYDSQLQTHSVQGQHAGVCPQWLAPTTSQEN